MKRFALWVEFDVKPGAVPALLNAAGQDGRGSMAHAHGAERTVAEAGQ